MTEENLRHCGLRDKENGGCGETGLTERRKVEETGNITGKEPDRGSTRRLETNVLRDPLG